MVSFPRHSSLDQINTRVWFKESSRSGGRAATLDNIPDAELDRLPAWGRNTCHSMDGRTSESNAVEGRLGLSMARARR
jgi:hypothetical protein